MIRESGCGLLNLLSTILPGGTKETHGRLRIAGAQPEYRHIATRL
jgi:hypothetical protein